MLVIIICKLNAHGPRLGVCIAMCIHMQKQKERATASSRHWERVGRRSRQGEQVVAYGGVAPGQPAHYHYLECGIMANGGVRDLRKPVI